jgi:AP-1-like factor
MDSHSFDYWMAQGNYAAPSHQAAVFDMPPELSKVPSLSGSPVSSTYDQFPTQIQHAYYPQIVDEPMQFGSYPMPMTPSDFGSDHDSPYCSPRPLQHVEPSFRAVPTPAPAERTHTTSGVSPTEPMHPAFYLTITSADELKTGRLSELSASEKKSTHEIWKLNSPS